MPVNPIPHGLVLFEADFDTLPGGVALGGAAPFPFDSATLGAGNTAQNTASEGRSGSDNGLLIQFGGTTADAYLTKAILSSDPTQIVLFFGFSIKKKSNGLSNGNSITLLDLKNGATSKVSLKFVRGVGNGTFQLTYQNFGTGGSANGVTTITNAWTDCLVELGSNYAKLYLNGSGTPEITLSFNISINAAIDTVDIGEKTGAVIPTSGEKSDFDNIFFEWTGGGILTSMPPGVLSSFFGLCSAMMPGFSSIGNPKR